MPRRRRRSPAAAPGPTAPASAKVNVKVFRKDSLVQAEWQLIHTEANVAIGVHSQNVEVALPDGDYTSGFYRVEIEQ